MCHPTQPSGASSESHPHSGACRSRDCRDNNAPCALEGFRRMASSSTIISSSRAGKAVARRCCLSLGRVLRWIACFVSKRSGEPRERVPEHRMFKSTARRYASLQEDEGILAQSRPGQIVSHVQQGLDVSVQRIETNARRSCASPVSRKRSAIMRKSSRSSASVSSITALRFAGAAHVAQQRGLQRAGLQILPHWSSRLRSTCSSASGRSPRSALIDASA